MKHFITEKQIIRNEFRLSKFLWYLKIQKYYSFISKNTVLSSDFGKIVTGSLNELIFGWFIFSGLEIRKIGSVPWYIISNYLELLLWRMFYCLFPHTKVLKYHLNMIFNHQMTIGKRHIKLNKRIILVEDSHFFFLEFVTFFTIQWLHELHKWELPLLL